MSEPELEARIAAYLDHCEPARAPVRISGLRRFHGGASRETFRFTAEDGTGASRALILRRDPVASLIDTERALEFNAYRSFHGTDVPVPEPVALELEEHWLDRPFFIMEEIQGAQATSPFAPDAYAGIEERIGGQFWPILGRIAAPDPMTLPIAQVTDHPQLDQCWRRELNHWERVFDEDELEPQPIARAAIRYLRRNPPPPAPKLSVVHGDYRSGNFLYTHEGDVRAILDWEMAHLGDPHEDLAWALDPMWCHGTPDKPGGMIDEARALGLWEQASGLTVNPEALHWWRIFACVKGLAIWVSSAKEYAQGANLDPVLAFSGWFCSTRHNVILLDAMGK